MIYLASPYSGTPEQQQARHDETERHVVAAIRQRIPLFSPITTWHSIAKRENLPGDADFWWGYNENMLLRSDVLVMLMLEGAQESKGMQMEFALAQDIPIPIVVYTPDANVPLEQQWASLARHILQLKKLDLMSTRQMKPN